MPAESLKISNYIFFNIRLYGSADFLIFYIHNWRVDEYKEKEQIDEQELLSEPEVDRNNIRHLRILREFCMKNHLNFTTLKSKKMRKHLATCTTILPRNNQQHLSKFISYNEGEHYDIFQRKRSTDIPIVGCIINHRSYN